jgi:tRNA (cmo5U34)-methyltransferase
MSTWNFDKVASAFNEHITEQLPWYPLFNQLVLTETARYFIKKNSIVYDIGASIGNVEKHLDFLLLERNVKFVPIEENELMATKYVGNYRDRLHVGDATQYNYEPFSFATSILTLSFIHPSERQILIQELMQKCMIGGAILVLEKMENKEGPIGSIQNRITWQAKLNGNVPMRDIVDKEISLSGSQIPLHANELEGFHKIWQFGDFCAWLYLRKEYI